MGVTWDSLAEGEGPEPKEIGPLTRTDFVRYQGASGDMNPIHHDEEFAKSAGFPIVFSVGMLQAGVLGTLLHGVARRGEHPPLRSAVPRAGVARRPPRLHGEVVAKYDDGGRAQGRPRPARHPCRERRRRDQGRSDLRRPVEHACDAQVAPRPPAPIASRPLELVERAGTRARARARCACGCTRAGAAAPTCTSSRATSSSPHLPVVPGHQVVGTVDALGRGCRSARRSVTGSASPGCTETCRRVRVLPPRRGEPLRARAFTGWTADGGYADALDRARGRSPSRLPEQLGDLEAAPLLCAGVIGYRALRRAEVQPGDRVALFGFGASAHLAIQVLHHWGCEVVVLTRGERHRELARELGRGVGRATRRSCRRHRATGPSCSHPRASWCRSRSTPVRPGGTVSLAGIHMSDIPSFEYRRLWRERSLRSVANMTRRDAEEFMALAAEAGVRAEYRAYPLEDANEALPAIKADAVRGAAVLAGRG